jgi:hypothetical protein
MSVDSANATVKQWICGANLQKPEAPSLNTDWRGKASCS